MDTATDHLDHPDHQRWLQALAAEPWRFDFYQALRRIESLHPQLPRLGEAARPGDEALRVGQSASMDFAPAALQALQRRDDGTLLLVQRVFGMLGPNGALPLHITELAHNRASHQGDATLRRFLDLLTHRFALLFYRAWAQAQPVVGLDRGDRNPFDHRIGALAGIGLPTLQQRDALGDGSKLHFAGRLSRQTRDAEGLLAWCRAQFGVTVQMQSWCGHWMAVAAPERTRLGGRERLGRGALLGASVWDVQHKFRLVIGPLRLARFRQFLPGGADLARLQAIVRHWVGLELAWDLQLILAREDVPPLRVGPGGGPMLGRTTWLGSYRRPRDAGDLVIDVESTLRRRPVPRAAQAPA